MDVSGAARLAVAAASCILWLSSPTEAQNYRAQCIANADANKSSCQRVCLQNRHTSDARRRCYNDCDITHSETMQTCQTYKSR